MGAGESCFLNPKGLTQKGNEDVIQARLLLWVGEQLNSPSGEFCFSTLPEKETLSPSSLMNLFRVSQTQSRRGKGSALTGVSPPVLQCHFREGTQHSANFFFAVSRFTTAPQAKLESSVMGPAGPF